MKPCPFCGASVTLKDIDGLTFIVCDGWAECRGSGLRSFYLSEEFESALATWNSRAPTLLDALCKPSKCCEGELLVPLHSTNTKICTGCKLEHPWPLEAGQKRTFD